MKPQFNFDVSVTGGKLEAILRYSPWSLCNLIYTLETKLEGYADIQKGTKD